MEKLVENLSVKDYDEVEDMLFELLQEHYGIERHSFDYLEENVEYIAGTINIVKLGDKPNTLKHRNHKNEWSSDIKVTESYEYATYYRLDKLNNLCKNVLSGSWSETYNFRRVLESFTDAE
jgi:predicted transcriptional regulator YheO